MINDFFKGASFLFQGIKDIFHPGIKRYVLVPILINVLIFAPLFYYSVHFINEKLNFLTVTSLPSWLNWISYLLSSLKLFIMITVVTLLLGIFSVIATIGANLIASPFNGLLSESFSRKLGTHLPSQSLLQTIKASIWRELVKFCYYLPRALGVLVLLGTFYFIPLLNLLIPFLFYWFSAWMMAIQYLDYPADNFHVSFKEFRQIIKAKRLLCLGFGLMVALFSSIPLMNLVIMPAAVLGATRIWLELKDHTQKDHHTPLRSHPL